MEEERGFREQNLVKAQKGDTVKEESGVTRGEGIVNSYQRRGVAKKGKA